MSDCVLGPNEAGVFLSQICYELLCNVQFEHNFDIKLWKSRLDTPFQLDSSCLQIVNKWNQFLNQAPLADIIQQKLMYYPYLHSIIGLLNILNSNFILLKTTICITTQIMDENFEKNLYKDFIKLIDSLNRHLTEWKEKVLDLHVFYSNYGKPKNWKQISVERNTKEFRKELKEELNYVPTDCDDEEIQMILRNIYKKMIFHEKPSQFLSYYNNIQNKNDMKKLIIAVSYLDENLLCKISRTKTNSYILNENLQIFFKLINYKHRFINNEEYWKSWLKDEYLNATNIDLTKDAKILKKQNEISNQERVKEKIKIKDIILKTDIQEKQQFEWINMKNVQQTIINHFNYINNYWPKEKEEEVGDFQN